MDISLKEKILGALFGYAIGDSLGLGTEFMTQKEVSRRYPNGLQDYQQIIRDAHRAQWKRGSWTNVTEIVIKVLESYVALGKFDYKDIACRLREWYLSNPVDLTRHQRILLSREDYASDPFESVSKSWQKIGLTENSSECLGKTLFAFLSSDPLSTAVNLCRLSHPQGRSTMASRVIASMTHSLFSFNKPASYETILGVANEMNENVAKYVEQAFFGNIDEFRLDDPDKYWDVRKAMGAALWCVWHCDSIEEALLTIVAEGGDADTNASLAVALMGLKYGYSSIPKKYIDHLIDKDRLFELADKLISTIESQE